MNVPAEVQELLDAGIVVECFDDGSFRCKDSTGHWVSERYCCRRCLDEHRIEFADERYSLGIYAGKYCDRHWETSGYRKDGPEGFDPAYAGESYYED